LAIYEQKIKIKKKVKCPTKRRIITTGAIIKYFIYKRVLSQIQFIYLPKIRIFLKIREVNNLGFQPSQVSHN
jgi:hypothetical protein